VAGKKKQVNPATGGKDKGQGKRRILIKKRKEGEQESTQPGEDPRTKQRKKRGHPKVTKKIKSDEEQELSSLGKQG